MKIRPAYSILLLLTAVIISCDTRQQKDTTHINDSAKSKIDSLSHDSILLNENLKEDVFIPNENLTEILEPIRENFRRIKSVRKWDDTVKTDLEETTEGGEVTYYYLDGHLEKIVSQHFGETFQQFTEFYLLNGQLSFVLEKSYQYNRPMYYDSSAMKENNDNEVFDFKKSKISEYRSYFDKGQLIYQINNKHDRPPTTASYLMSEHKRIKTEFERFVKLAKSK